MEDLARSVLLFQQTVAAHRLIRFFRLRGFRGALRRGMHGLLAKRTQPVAALATDASALEAVMEVASGRVQGGR